MLPNFSPPFVDPLLHQAMALFHRHQMRHIFIPVIFIANR
jgi:hypothetical protein